MRKLGKILGIMMAGLILVACSNGGSADGEVVNVGVLQFIDHNSLNAAQEGFIDGLEEAGYTDGENLELDLLNAQGDQANLQSMSEQLTGRNELVLGIATPTAQALAMADNSTPILFTAVTDPVDAGIVDSGEQPGGNVTGTTDMFDIEAQVNLLIDITPDVQTIGLIYNSSEVNSQLQVEQAIEVIEARDLDYQVQTVTSTNDVQQSFMTLAQDVDGVFIPTDNIISATAPTIGEIAREENLPVVAGAISMVEDGGLATLGIDYYELGKQTADMAVQILEGADPKDLPVESTQDFELYINEDMAEAIGIDPEDIRQAANQ